MHFPSHHKREIGHYLVQEMTNLGREAGYAVIIAHTADVNIPSMALFSKEGFVKSGQLPMIGFRNCKWMDLTVWHKDVRTVLTPSQPIPLGVEQVQ
jgi:L-amino acid N-acyltransferase YncA